MADYPTSAPTFDTPGTNLDSPAHSGLHTKTDEELAAVIAELGLAPSDVFSSVKARLDSMAEQLDNLPPAIESGVDTISSDGSGEFSFTFPNAFTSAPVVPLPSISGTSVFTVTIFSVTTTGLTGTMRNLSTGATYNNNSLTMRWIAIGTLA